MEASEVELRERLEKLAKYLREPTYGDGDYYAGYATAEATIAFQIDEILNS